MYAVGRLGSYISQGVYTVSGPFHPFGGAVDIIVVQQQDGSFKSSPWYVRFGKFQGVLKSKKKVVTVFVDGVEANFHMYLDHKGEAYFLREVDDIEEEETALYPLSSGEETDGLSKNDRRPLKSKSCNYDAIKSSSDKQIAVHNEKALTRAKSGQSRLRGLFGRKKSEESFHENEGNASVVRVSSLERAEFAADLLELQWSTNLSTRKTKKGNPSNLSSLDKLHVESDKGLQTHDEKGLPSFCAHDAIKNNFDNAILLEETGSHNKPIDSNSQCDSEKLNCSAEEATLGTSCLRTHEKVVETLTGEKVEEKCEIIPLISRETHETCDDNGDHDVNANGNGAISEIADPKSQLPYSIKLEACSGQEFLVDQAPHEEDCILQGCILSQMDSSRNGVQSSLECEMSDSSIVKLDNSGKQTNGTLCLDNEGNVEVHAHAETQHRATELPSEDTGAEQLAGDTRLDTELAEHSENHCHPTSSSCSWTPNHKDEDLKNSVTETESYASIARVNPKIGSVEEVKSLSVCTTSSSTDSGQQVVEDESINSSLQRNLASSGDLKKLYGDNIPTKVTSVEPSQSSEEEQFLIGDLDEFKPNAVEPISPDQVGKENHTSFSLEGTKEVLESVSTGYESYSSLDKFVSDNPSIRTETSEAKSRVTSSPISIPRSSTTAGEEVVRLGESMPNMWFRLDNLDTHSNVCHPLSRSLDASPKSLKLTLLSKDDSNHSIPDTEGKHLGNEQPNMEDTPILGELNSPAAIPAVGMLSLGGEQIFESETEDRFDKPIEGDHSKPTSTPSGRWILWPFAFRRSRSGKAKQPSSSDARFSDAVNATESTSSTDEKINELRPKGVKKMYRANTPTSEQLAALNLREGRNTITFTFSTGMLGDQQVDARIYLWKWNARIVISDVDGTITKSDVLGQFMPMVGIDWCQTGVAHLFSAIKENGYQLLFLSARAIAQAYHTRQFLLNIKQNGKALPDGPIVISPDGLFPSLFREVIRRAPHEFKIACLEDIRALFPSDCNPFYAGFGNRDTDEISYLKVGIPKGKIFTINPKGEVAVNRRVDTKSYTSLHDLVHDMFPPTSAEQEDFNSWNFWKLPPPHFDF